MSLFPWGDVHVTWCANEALLLHVRCGTPLCFDMKTFAVYRCSVLHETGSSDADDSLSLTLV
jgi:hypothetical protein